MFSQGYRPGTLGNRGLSPEELATLRPGLVYVSLCAFSHVGPWASRRGFDTVVQTVSGITTRQAELFPGAEPGPQFYPVSAIDYLTGYLMAVGAMVALARRAREGGSWLVRISLAQTGRWLVSRGEVPEAELKDLPKEFTPPELARWSIESQTPAGKLKHLHRPFSFPRRRLSGRARRCRSATTSRPGRLGRNCQPIAVDTARDYGKPRMNRLLQDLRIVEFSAFVAAPLGGMTMAQFGAEVIRIDPIGGAIDYNRWPVTDSGASLYWAGLNKAKRSVALALNKPEGRELAQAIATAPGPGGGIVLTNLPPLPGLDYASLKAKRDDVIVLRLTGNRDGSAAVDYTVNAASGFPLVTGNNTAPAPCRSIMSCRPGTSRRVCISRPPCSPPSGTAPAPARGRRSRRRSAT